MDVLLQDSALSASHLAISHINCKTLFDEDWCSYIVEECRFIAHLLIYVMIVPHWLIIKEFHSHKTSVVAIPMYRHTPYDYLNTAP